MKVFIISIIMIALVGFQSCKKLVEVPAPVTSINQDNVFTTDATATANLFSVYSALSTGFLISTNSVYAFATGSVGLSSDELVHYAPLSNNSIARYYRNAVVSSDAAMFQYGYASLFTLNNQIEQLPKADQLSTSVRQKLLGEAHFLRAYHYFYLVNTYGDVPLVLTTDYKVNAVIARSPQTEVYRQIIEDLIKAKSLLSKKYLSIDGVAESQERTVANYYAATALLARVYLYNKQYAEAEKEASEVIAQTDLYGLVPLSEVFLANSKEAIFQLQPVNQGWNTEDARFFKVPASGFTGQSPVYLSSYMLNAFQPGDLRRTEWVGKYTDTKVTPNKDYYYPLKYKSATINAPVTEYSTVLRLAEQYLIRAEARANLNNSTGAIDDINKLRTRARDNSGAVIDSLPDLQNNLSQSQIMTAILHERQVELFSESGHRWFDLKRLGLLDSVMSAVQISQEKNRTWSSFRQYFPIQDNDSRFNPNLTQTPGY